MDGIRVLGWWKKEEESVSIAQPLFFSSFYSAILLLQLLV